MGVMNKILNNPVRKRINKKFSNCLNWLGKGQEKVSPGEERN
jgi:hypothetical protein